MAEERRKSRDPGDTMALAGLAFVVSISLLPVLLATVAARLVLGRLRVKLRRMENVALFLGSVAAFVLYPWLLTSYFVWLASPLTSASYWQVPIVSLLVMPLPLLALWGLIEGTSVASRLPRKLLRTGDPMAEESILPSEKDRERSKVVAPPGGVVASATSHSSLKQTEPEGRRFVPLGVDAHGTPAGCYEHELGTHMMVLGSTGAGKTEALKALAAGMMDLGWRGLVLDLKEDTKKARPGEASGSGGFEDFLETYASHHAIPFQRMALSDPTPAVWYNPLYGMKADASKDALLAMQDFDSGYWESINRKMLGQALNLLYDAHAADPTQFVYPTVYELGKLISAGPNLKTESRRYVETVLQLVPTRSKDDYGVLIKPSKDEAESAAGLGARLTNMYDSMAGRSLLRATGDRPVLDVQMDGLTYVGLDTQGLPDLSQMVAATVLQRMAVYAADRTTGNVVEKGPPRKRFLLIDEANNVKARAIVQTLLQKARAAGICVILSTQSPTDWVDERGDDWDSMSQNINVAVIMSQGSRGPAEMAADYIGKHRRMQSSWQYQDGRVMDQANLREMEDHLVTPDQLRGLEIGEAILRIGKPKERVGWIRVVMRDPTRHADLR